MACLIFISWWGTSSKSFKRKGEEMNKALSRIGPTFFRPAVRCSTSWGSSNTRSWASGDLCLKMSSYLWPNVEGLLFTRISLTIFTHRWRCWGIIIIMIQSRWNMIDHTMHTVWIHFCPMPERRKNIWTSPESNPWACVPTLAGGCFIPFAKASWLMWDLDELK